MNVSLFFAILLAVLASLCFAGSSTVQGLAVGRQIGENLAKERLRRGDILALLRAPRWLAGLVLAGAGSALNVAALVLAPVTVVQPLGVLAVPWSVLLVALVRRSRVSRLKLTAVVQTLAGTVAFTVLAAKYTATGAPPAALRVAVACAVVYAGAEGLGQLGARWRMRWRSLFWATGGAFYYGLESALVKTLTELLRQPSWLADPMVWLIGAGIAFGAVRAAWMIQQAYATGPSEAVVGALTVTNPVVAVSFGMIVLSEARSLDFGAATGMVVAAVLAVSGVVLLSQAGSATTVRPGT